MSRVFLISSNTTVEPHPVYPLGMALIAASLTKHGHDVLQFDLLFNNEREAPSMASAISDFDPDFIGISIRNIDNVDSLSTGENWYLAAIKSLVKKIRTVSARPIIVGGPAFSIMPQAILDFIDADFGIVGEGEQALPALMAVLNEKKNPDKIIWPQKAFITGDGFFSPCYDKTLVDYYVDKAGMLNYQTKRGCPHTCNYCTYPIIEGRRFRMQDPEFVVENLKKIKREFGVDTVFFTDSVFNDSQNHYLEVAEALVRHDCKIRWAAYFRPRKISPEELRLLKRSGLYAMEVGSDAACDETLKGIGKTFAFDDILHFNNSCIQEEIACAHFFMFGGPGESPKTIEESLKNIARLEKCPVFAFSGIRILPGTGLQAIAVKEGIIKKENDLLHPFYYVSPLVEKQEMETTLTAAFKKRKEWFFPPQEGQIRMQTLQLFGFKGLLWDMLVNFSNVNRKRRSRKTG